MASLIKTFECAVVNHEIVRYPIHFIESALSLRLHYKNSSNSRDVYHAVDESEISTILGHT